jgi:DNA-binding transcriptional MerR regulator
MNINDFPKRIFFSTEEVADFLQLNASNLRYWEKEFNLKIKRDSKNRRLYTRDDIDYLKKINYLVNTRGLSIKAAILAYKNKKNEIEQKEKITEKLLSLKEQLKSLRDSISKETDNTIF